MKINRMLIAVLFSALVAVFVSCSDGGSSDGDSSTTTDLPAPKNGYFRINYLGNASELWLWDDFDETEIAKCTNWDSAGFPMSGKNGSFSYADIKLAESPVQVSFIVRSEPGDKGNLTGDLQFLFPSKYSEVFVKGKTIYIDKDCTQVAKGLVSAVITSENLISLRLDGGVRASKDTVKIEANGKSLTLASVGSSGTVVVVENLKELGAVSVTFKDENGSDVRMAVPDGSLIDDWYRLDDISVLGYKNGVFTTWAPLSSKAQVFLFSDAVSAKQGKATGEPIDMVRQPNGTWTTGNVSAKVGTNKYYKYRFVNNGNTYDVCDIWAKVAAKDSIATQIIDINDTSAQPVDWEASYTNPFKSTNYTDAVIYEMHITDWSQAFRSSMQEDNPGTFKEITDALGTNGSGEFARHLKDLGITHVQILPMFEYAVTTKRSNDNSTKENDNAYNWGYNPYNYNTPESRYAALKDSSDGTEAVKAMRQMIQSFHDAGIAVIMDVVYNHTNGTQSGSVYDMTIPQYFYRVDGSTYINGSGCGNETATNHKMVKEYVIDSLKHWMTDYHINGFRFDLMGIHESETMKEIYAALYEIDPNVIVYGEPWTGGTSGVIEGATSAVEGTAGNGVGAFDDDFRDAIKGAEFGGFKKGQVQGIFNDNGILLGLCGKPGKNGRNKTDNLGLALHYVECHDNYTLYDKLIYSTLKDTELNGDFADKFKAADKSVKDDENMLSGIKKQDMLAAAYVFLSQGTPFINGGQEFLRTKQGDPDSYAADNKGGVFWSNIDAVNAIDRSFKTKYSDVYNTYKGLIALRKENPEAFGSNKDAKAETVKDADEKNINGVTKYTTGDFLVYFNATDEAVDITTTGYTKAVDVSSGTPTDSATLPATVDAKSFVILKK